MIDEVSYVSFFPLTSSDHLVWMLPPIHLYFLHFIHFNSSFYFGFILKFDPFHLISLIFGWFSIVHFSHFFVLNLIYLCNWWLLFRERIQHPSTNYFLWSFNVFIVLWYGWLVPKAVTPYFCHPHLCVIFTRYNFIHFSFHHSFHPTTLFGRCYLFTFISCISFTSSLHFISHICCIFIWFIWFHWFLADFQSSIFPIFSHDFDLPLSLVITISWTCTTFIN